MIQESKDILKDEKFYSFSFSEHAIPFDFIHSRAKIYIYAK